MVKSHHLCRGFACVAKQFFDKILAIASGIYRKKRKKETPALRVPAGACHDESRVQFLYFLAQIKTCFFLLLPIVCMDASPIVGQLVSGARAYSPPTRVRLTNSEGQGWWSLLYCRCVSVWLRVCVCVCVCVWSIDWWGYTQSITAAQARVGR